MTDTAVLSPGARHKLLLAKQPEPTQHAYSAFSIRARTVIAQDLSYPRAGVRQLPDGPWLLQLWYAPDTVRTDAEPLTFSTRVAAFISGQHEVHAARDREPPAGQIHLRGVARAVNA
ncbi:hypothetical protein [Arthrobacter glacialis]|uniref:hypothetical protein n=1 Tax=Arthrobacter glacialis TaxID=1664 RepID=UPI000CD40394|nr:hypothetical protein [Arthrobacter glacialis]POH58895.1 hypothetical protein CVS28_09305 [Arthrobacter glacialis]